ncbi:RlfB protein [Vibrio lentus]|uniref:RlfB protein n=1 Tax=Vibrio lentus TaxID=136468 RepID=UPI000C82E6C9|nr:RlfB protein [Vibrio lentus]MCC5486532.1 RlfB protein [Vibrio lentus]MCC5493818.1 RlfB protein [Vibrio lentus]
MLNEPIDLTRVDATRIIDSLYDIFDRDFVSNRTYLANSIYVDPQSQRKDEGKELSFWHLTTRKDTYFDWINGKKVKVEGDRYPDFQRASRLEWIKQILTNHDDDCIKMFFYKEQAKKNPIRLYLWAEEHDFVVILQKLGNSSSFLVTSFYVDHNKKRRDFQSRYEAYLDNSTGLANHRWF